MFWQIKERLFSIVDYLQGGGVVMMPLVLLSVILWTLIINRTLFFNRLYRKNMPREEAGRCVRSNISPDKTVYRGAVSLLVSEFMKRRSGISDIDRDILDESVMSVVASLENHLTLIGVLAGIAPLFGLLGTVSGMVTTFDVIAAFGTGNVMAMADGIAEALITTQAGLLVAIPALYMRNYLGLRANNLKHRISSVGIYLKQYV